MKTKYIFEDNVEANQTNLLDLAKEYFGKDKMRKMDENTVFFELAPHILFDVKHNSFIDFSSGKGGKPIDFAAHQSKEKLHAIIYELLDGLKEHRYSRYYDPELFSLPIKDDGVADVFRYLCETKHIDDDIVRDMVHRGILYQTSKLVGSDMYHEDVFTHAVVFLGKNENGDIVYAYVQSTEKPQDFYHSIRYTVPHSSPKIAFTVEGKNETLWVYENPIDLLCAASLEKLNGMDWRDHHRMALPTGGLEPVLDYIRARNVKTIVLAIDPTQEVSSFSSILPSDITVFSLKMKSLQKALRRNNKNPRNLKGWLLPSLEEFSLF